MLKRWRATEPVRVYLYGIVLAVLLVLVAYGLLTAELVPLWAGLAAAVLLAPGIEAARNRVTPVGQHRR